MNQIKSIRKLCFIPLLFLLLFSLSGCASSAEPLQMNGMYFDTIVTIRIWDTSDRSVLEECEKLCQKYENLFSRTIDTSDVSRINQANGQPVTVDQETADLIKTALHYGDLSDGKFDITIAPLSELWNFGHNDGQIPDPAAIEEARSHVNYKKRQSGRYYRSASGSKGCHRSWSDCKGLYCRSAERVSGKRRD